MGFTDSRERAFVKKFDVVVVGAGTGGCTAAKAAAEAGLEVCLVDRKGEGDIGDKVCGDAIGKHHFDRLKLAYPAGDELERKISGVDIYSPDEETVFRIKSEALFGFMLNRRLFGQRLLRHALNAGSSLMDSTHVLGPLLEGGFVVGVLARKVDSEEKFELRGRVVVDASGFSAVLRRQLPPELGIEAAASPGDEVVCYREIRRLREPIEEPDFCRMYVSQAISPGGYCWIFPEGGTRVNVGLGVAPLGKFPSPKRQLYELVLSRLLFEGSTAVTGGGGYLPTRRPLDSAVGDGILLVGEAAFHVNPSHGGGMGPSMIGGASAGEVVVGALEAGDVSRRGLWSHNVRYMEAYGVKQAGLDVFRLFLQGLGDANLNHGMKYRLLTEEDILRASMDEEVRLSITEATRRVLQSLGRLTLLRRLRDAAGLMKRVRAWYRNYPTSPQGFEEWRRNAWDLFRVARSRF